MSSNITPAALTPPAPHMKGNGADSGAAGTSGFSGLLDGPAAAGHEHHEQTLPSRTADPNTLTPPSSNERETADRTKRNASEHLSAPAAKDEESAADAEKEKGDAVRPKHKNAPIDVSAILFGLSMSVIVNTFQSASGGASQSSTGGRESGAGGGIAGHEKNAPVEGRTKSDMGPTPSGASVSPPPMEGGESGPAESGHTIPATAAGRPNADIPRQPVSGPSLRGVTVTAVSGTPPIAAPAVADNPQLAGVVQGSANTAPSDETGWNTGTNATGTDTDAQGGTSQATNQAPSTTPAKSRSTDPQTGGHAGSNGHGGGDNGDRSSSAILHNVSSHTETAGSAPFVGIGGSSTPLLGQTAASFVAGMGTPQSWTAYLSEVAYMTTASMAAPVRSLSIALQPAELGSVTANLHLSGKQLRIDVEVQTQEAHQRLTNDADDIIKSLRSLGFDVSHVTIRHAGNALPPAQGASHPAGQAQGNMPFQASPNPGGSNSGGGARNNTGKHDADRASHAPVSQPVGNDSVSRGLYI